jgi:ABC-type transport system substrate-binding protein
MKKEIPIIMDRNASIAAYQQAQQMIMEDIPGIFYADRSAIVVKRSSIKGYNHDPAYGVFFYKLYRQ